MLHFDPSPSSLAGVLAFHTSSSNFSPSVNIPPTVLLCPLVGFGIPGPAHTVPCSDYHLCKYPHRPAVPLTTLYPGIVVNLLKASVGVTACFAPCSGHTTLLYHYVGATVLSEEIFISFSFFFMCCLIINMDVCCGGKDTVRACHCNSAETAQLTPSKVPLFTCKININKYKYIWIYTFYSFCPALYNTCETFFGFPPSRGIIAAVFGTLWMKMYLGDSACYCHVFNFLFGCFFLFVCLFSFFLFFSCSFCVQACLEKKIPTFLRTL